MKPRSNNLKEIMKKDLSQPRIGLTRHKKQVKKAWKSIKKIKF
jgi:hypothetical protein